MASHTKKKRSKRSKRASALITGLLIAVWLALLLYPTASDWWNQVHQSTAVVQYNDKVRELDDPSRQAMWDEAVRYNQLLLQSYEGVEPEGIPAYDSVLNVTGDGTMSVVTIPKIDVRVPVLHGTDEGMLLNHIGHLPTSSMPVGGTGTHCVLVGHRGLPSAVLFTNLDELEVGDLFYLETLGERMAYEVDQILTVLPNEVDALAIDPDADLCTLVTCTPYGINSHRLLVRGHRTELPPEAESGEALEQVGHHVHPVVWVILLAVAILGVLALLWFGRRHRRKKETAE